MTLLRALHSGHSQEHVLGFCMWTDTWVHIYAKFILGSLARMPPRTAQHTCAFIPTRTCTWMMWCEQCEHPHPHRQLLAQTLNLSRPSRGSPSLQAVKRRQRDQHSQQAQQ